MTAHSRFRKLVAVAAGALIASTAMAAATVAPADAGVPKHKHEIYMYKVEKNIKLAGVGSDTVGDSEDQVVSCDPNDYVLDGMWNIQHVDQYNPPVVDPDDNTGYPVPSSSGVYNDLRDVWVKSSYPNQGNWYSWNFSLKNKAYGDAQVKLFVTCIRSSTEYTNGHRHDFHIRSLFGGAAVNQSNGSRSYVDGSVYGSCTPDEVFVAPGFSFPTADFRLVGSYPNSTSSWVWEFGIDNVTLPSVGVYGRCLDRRVFDGGTARHAVAMKHLPSVSPGGWPTKFVPQGDPREFQYSCDQDNSTYHGYKAMVGWFYLGNHWEDNWYLGSEPRPKTRTWNFWNWNASNAEVKYGALCINSRTSNPIL